MSDPLKVISTRDGSSTIYHKELNETYHSMHGALTESRHVFIKNGLDHLLERPNHQQAIKIFEIGFGSGLNALLTYEWAMLHQLVTHYHSIEAYPLTQDIVTKLTYFPKENFLYPLFFDLHNLQWDQEFKISEYFWLKKIHSLLNTYSIQKEQYDIIFYDAFAPSKQPEMWEKPLIEKVVDSLHINGVFVTYCAKGQLKRDLKELGCEVETLTGPPGKKEMVRATKIHTP